jgi:hypothetical protein
MIVTLNNAVALALKSMRLTDESGEFSFLDNVKVGVKMHCRNVTAE